MYCDTKDHKHQQKTYFVSWYTSERNSYAHLTTEADPNKNEFNGHVYHRYQVMCDCCIVNVIMVTWVTTPPPTTPTLPVLFVSNLTTLPTLVLYRSSNQKDVSKIRQILQRSNCQNVFIHLNFWQHFYPSVGLVASWWHSN